MSFEMIKPMIGKVFTSVEALGGAIHFKNDAEQVTFYHSQNCCEHVWVEDVCGDWDDLVGSPILVAEEVTSEDVQNLENGINTTEEEEEDDYGVTEWTFYRFSTIKGSVTVRWCGTSNGYYSTSVNWLHVVYGVNDDDLNWI